jgi:hypothetical protein
VVWNIWMIFPYIGNNHSHWLSYFSEGLKPPTRLIGDWYGIFIGKSIINDLKEIRNTI